MFGALDSILLYLGLILAILFILICVVLKLITTPYPIINRSENEKYYLDPKSNKKHTFPTLSDLPTVKLSVVIPAYNEQDRLPPMLDECLAHLKSKSDSDPEFTFEVIVVSDGSKDNTVKVATEYSNKYGTDVFRVLELERNRGKGGAVRLGVQSTRGEMILFADADGATKFSDFDKLESILHMLKDSNDKENLLYNQFGIVIGSRAHLQQESIATRSLFRTILMYGFHFLVWLFAVRDIHDTQCGFKLFTRRTAEICFSNMHIERWAFDVELLYIAQSIDVPVLETPVNWTEIDGSKVEPFSSSIQMAKDLALLWLRYKIGAWKINYKKLK
ncbi:dolichyl-phosphate beta-glucosyltransferase [Ctenocephalides felis]|uniref:dolichyl-phosphate beta-glucosyltransferase n=1 Tax=Ctenocephalides felis TaxID=7515 RepID=UPI000E6E12D0|nr:dolichyl-phosphate beta-glucosyltransferase [Ctenocephalides felis]